MKKEDPSVIQKQMVSKHQIQDGDTVIITFKDERSFIERVESSKQIVIHQTKIKAEEVIGYSSNKWFRVNENRDASETLEPIDDLQAMDYLAIDDNMDGELEQTAFDEVTNQKLQDSEVFQRRTAFAQQKQLKKVRSNFASLCQIRIADPFFQIQRRFLMSDSQQPWALSGATVAEAMQFLGAGLIGAKRILVIDDFEGLPTAAVCQRLLCETGDLSGQHFIAFKTFCEALKPLDEFVDKEYSETELLKQQNAAKDLIMAAVAELHLPSFEDQAVVCSGRTVGGVLKDALIDCNLIPARLKAGGRGPLNPPSFNVSLSRFAADDWNQAAYGYFLDRNAAKQMKEQEFNDAAPQLTAESLAELLAYDYCTWLERRFEYLGVNTNLFQKLMRYRVDSGKLINATRKGVQPYIKASRPFYFDGIFICAKARPQPILQQVVKFARAGAAVTVFSTQQQPLVEALEWVVQAKNGCHVTAHELLELKQQFLPGRTHPEMVGQVAGGYLMRGFLQGESQVIGSGDVSGRRKGINNRVRQ